MATSITFQQLFQFLREEKSTNALGTIPPDFEEGVKELLLSIANKAQNEPDAQKELENAKRAALTLMQLRRQKIVLRSSVNEKSLVQGATVAEQEFYNTVKKACDEQEEKIIGITFAKKTVQIKNSKKIKMIKEVPAYKGADGNDYGPFGIGQEVELPSQEAEWMEKKGMAGTFE
ncbi:MAG: hypothetical protein WC492_03525 [Candidatus Micrarchaeia archaeon]